MKDRIRQLLDEAFAAIDDGGCLVSTILRKAIRIARLREDWSNVIWLSLELTDAAEPNGQMRAFHMALGAQAAHFEADHLAALWKGAFRNWANRRTAKVWRLEGGYEDEAKVLKWSVPQIENHIADLREKRGEAMSPDPEHMTPFYEPFGRAHARKDAEIYYDTMAGLFADILERIRQSVHGFLSKTEKELLTGHTYAKAIYADIQSTIEGLQELAPSAAREMQAALERLSAGSSEALSQGLCSCRRALKSLTDALYPATGKEVVGFDGCTRRMTEDKYINRLLQYVHENVRGSTLAKSVTTECESASRRLESLYELATKGVHESVDPGEAQHCVLHVFMLMGDILRIRRGSSAALEKRTKGEAQ